MESKFAVVFDSDAYHTRIIFTARNRTPTLAEFANLVEEHERDLAQQPCGKPLIIQLGRLPPTDQPTMPATLRMK